MQFSHTMQIQTPPIKKQLPVQSISHQVRGSFSITYILLLTTATITFIEAMRTKSEIVRHVLNLETCISVVAGYFYSVFMAKLDDAVKIGSPINWSELTLMRYIDWSITTPMMLLTLCIVLSNEIRTTIFLPVLLTIVALNYVMLYIGYLGETGVLDKITASITGFVPFFAMFGVVYYNYVRPKYSLANRLLFGTYLAIWSMYGLVYLLDEQSKNMVLNVLDLTAKCLIGLGLWLYYVHIVKI